MSNRLPTGPGQSIGGQRAPSRRESSGVSRRPPDVARARVGAPPTSEGPRPAFVAPVGHQAPDNLGRLDELGDRLERVMARIDAHPITKAYR